MSHTEYGFAPQHENPVPHGAPKRPLSINPRLLAAGCYVFLLASVVAIYYPVHHYPFLMNVDDDGYVFNNPQVLGPLNWAAIRRAFTHSFLLNYDPLTFLAHSINVRLFGLNAGGHHDINVLLHAVNALLLFFVLRKATGSTGRSLMVAALFALHPVNVENVAWVSELKTLLSATFFFLAIAAYLSYVRKPGRERMLGVTILFGLGLLAKPQVITLPFVLLLLDYWPLHRVPALQSANYRSALRQFWRLALEKLPLFFVAFVDVILTLHAENKPWVERYTLAIRMGTAVRSYAIYLCNALWPVHLAFDYLHPGYSLRWIEVGAAFSLLAAITGFVLYKRDRPYLLVGWLWFLGTMVPTINLVQIDLSPMADRYAYIPLVGLFLMMCWGVADLWRFEGFRLPALVCVSVAAVLVLGVLCRRQVHYWRDAEAVWIRSLEVTHRNWGSERGYGSFLLMVGRTQEALLYLHRAIEDRPGDFDLMVLTATAEHKEHHLREAISLYRKAMPLSPDNRKSAQILANMGHAYGDLGEIQQAQECYRKVHLLQGSTAP